MSKRPRIPRRTHIPGTFRTHERRGPDPGGEDRRIVLYLPLSALDRAEEQAVRAGVDSVQRYCESLLLDAIRAEDARHRAENPDAEARRGRIDGLLAIADDPAYLAEFTASLLGRAGPTPSGDGDAAQRPGDRSGPDEEPIVERPAADVVFLHAGLLGEAPGAFLAAIRRGEPVRPEVGRELMRALADLEAEHRGAPSLDRRLAYALHKLAFEGQVLVSESGAAVAVDEATVDLLRLVQEAVDRVLSGQDIRYYSPLP